MPGGIFSKLLFLSFHIRNKEEQSNLYRYRGDNLRRGKHPGDDERIEYRAGIDRSRQLVQPCRKHRRNGKKHDALCPRPLFIPPAEENKPDNVDTEEPPDDCVDHHHRKSMVDRHHVFMYAEEHQNKRQIEPQEDAVHGRIDRV